MESNRLIIRNLDNLQELTPEEVSTIQGSLSIAYPEEPLPEVPDQPSPKGRVWYPYPRPKRPKYPSPRPYPQPYPIPSIPCSPYPRKDGRLPWCAVIL
ncbi:MAG: hypothetical protein AAF152_15440 [Cyanobacteria bacterium P01_A01_bin.114]